MSIATELAIQKQYDQAARVNAAGVAVTTTVTALEYGNEAVHRTRLTLTACLVEVVSVTTGIGVGGTLIYQLPAGWVRFMGGVANLSMSIASAKQADFTDATPEGKIGVGTLAPANADALGTDATDDNICTATAYVCSAYADASITCPPEDDTLLDGTSAAKAVYVNVAVDAADIDDGVTTQVQISGTIDIFWQNLGTY